MVNELANKKLPLANILEFRRVLRRFLDISEGAPTNTVPVTEAISLTDEYVLISSQYQKL